ncbi:hypothetical protein [Desulforhopalus sp. 52FAK]
MPFVKISALPAKSYEIEEVIRAVEVRLYEGKGGFLPVGSATVLWQTLNAIAHTPEATGKQEYLYEFDAEKKEFPIFVDLYLTSVFSYGEIAKIMNSVTSTIAELTEIDPRFVFIHSHIGNPGHVFIDNGVWPCDIEHAGIKPEELKNN